MTTDFLHRSKEPFNPGQHEIVKWMHRIEWLGSVFINGV
jgi:hypothetical protein